MAGFELMGKEERDAVNEVFDKSGVLFRHGFEKMRNGIYKVDEFEREFAKKFNVQYARAVTSGTAALLVSLKALGVKPGDEVITQSFTFVATVEAIIEAGAIPVITEINKTLNMDPGDLERKVTKRTRVIIPVHMMGVSAQMEEIMAIAKKHNLFVLEDSAQAIGGEYKRKKLGTIGDVGIFSFDFGKALTTGEGGMVITNNKEIYLRAKEYSDHGHEGNPNFPRGEDTRRMSGFNYNMIELQGAIGLVQLKKLGYGQSQQKENKKKIKNGIENIPGIEFREIPDSEGACGDNLVFFLDSKEKAEKFAKILQEKGIGTNILPSAIKWHFAGTWDHMLPQFDRYNGKNLMEEWRKSYEILNRAIAVSIPIKMDDNRINNIIDTLTQIFKEI